MLARFDNGSSTASDHWELRSPVSDKVLRVVQESATLVDAGDALLEVGDAADLEVEVDVLSSDAIQVRPGARVSLEAWGGDRRLVGSVRYVEPAAYLKISALGIEEQRVNVIIDLLEPIETRLRLDDAYRVEAKITVWESPNVLPSGRSFAKATLGPPTPSKLSGRAFAR
jgi:HlyD family secretion protein